jgi:hypothetical protein
MARPREKLQHPKAARVLCSIGGEILWSGNKQCYVYSGGDTRIWSLSRDITFPELMSKLTGFYHTTSSLKYQLPDLDLDTLVSLSDDDDLDRMMEEYDVAEGSGQRLRLFLFPVGEWREGRQKERALGSREASPRVGCGMLLCMQCCCDLVCEQSLLVVDGVRSWCCLPRLAI